MAPDRRKERIFDQNAPKVMALVHELRRQRFTWVEIFMLFVGGVRALAEADEPAPLQTSDLRDLRVAQLELLQSHYQEAASPDDKTTFLDWVVLALLVRDLGGDLRALERKHTLTLIRDVYAKRAAELDQMLREE